MITWATRTEKKWTSLLAEGGGRLQEVFVIFGGEKRSICGPITAFAGAQRGVDVASLSESKLGLAEVGPSD